MKIRQVVDEIRGHVIYISPPLYFSNIIELRAKRRVETNTAK